jgi:hypothetical protein
MARKKSGPPKLPTAASNSDPAASSSDAVTVYPMPESGSAPGVNAINGAVSTINLET